MSRAEPSTTVRSLSQRIQQAVTTVLDGYAPEIDGDDHLRAVRFEVRVKPDGQVRAVIVSRESEFADK